MAMLQEVFSFLQWFSEGPFLKWVFITLFCVLVKAGVDYLRERQRNEAEADQRTHTFQIKCLGF